MTAAAALARVIALHSQSSEVGMADGKWCPECGQETPCRTIRAALTPPDYLGHLSREELRQRALDYDEEAETEQRLRETHGLSHAPLPEGVYLDPGFCAGCDAERTRIIPPGSDQS